MKKSIIRAVSLLLSLLMLLPVFAACGKTNEPDTTETTEATEETTGEASVSKLSINAENIASIKLVRSDELHSNSTEVSIFIAFSAQLQKIFGEFPEVGTDFAMPGKEPEEAELEIVIGDTLREASASFNDKLRDFNSMAYGISVSEGKICVGGTSPYLLYLALDRLLKLVTTDESGNPQLVLDYGFELIEKSETRYPSFDEVVSSGREFGFYSIEKLVKIPSQGSFNVLQGHGTDGKYAYFALVDKSGGSEKAIIRKYDMETWKLVATSSVLPSLHSNDITYDAKNHRLVLCTCAATDQWRGVVYVNPDTLELIEHTLVPTGARGIAYLADTNQYLCAHEYGYALTNDKFEQVGYIQDSYPKLTTQGFDCDGTYIYDPRWDKSATTQTIIVHKMDGEFIGALPLYGIEGEPEGIMRDNDGSFIMGCNGSNSAYRLVLLYKNWWE